MFPKPYKIALVAGEASSDLIGADLINGIFELNPQIKVLAVGGNKIKATQAQLLLENEVFSVMGLTEVLKDLPRILKVKKQMVEDILRFKPDIFIGVDSPDLNFSIAKDMKKQGIPVVHYVSPSVWAWRPKRVFKMEHFIDCLLTLFPFEVDLYQPTRIKATFVGHPLAQKIPVIVDKETVKESLDCGDQKVLALLPGSRNREIKQLMPVFADTIKQLKLGDEWQVMSSNVSTEKIKLVQSLAAEYELDIHWVEDTSTLLQAADFALLGSGTVALEAMLCKTPMVVAYQISRLTWFIVNTFKMMQLPYYSLPNVLHGDFLVPEVMQNDLTVDNLTTACKGVINDPNQIDLLKRFVEIHRQLLPAQENQAALTVMKFLEQTC